MTILSSRGCCNVRNTENVGAYCMRPIACTPIGRKALRPYKWSIVDAVGKRSVTAVPRPGVLSMVTLPP